MKRYATLIGGIIAVIYDAIYVILMLVGIVALLDLFKDVEGSSTLALLNLLDAVLATVSLIFNSLAITAYSCSHEKYLTKKRPLIITAIIVNSVLIGFCLMSFVNNMAKANIIILFLVSLLAVVMFIIDLTLEDKRYLDEAISSEDEE